MSVISNEPNLTNFNGRQPSPGEVGSPSNYLNRLNISTPSHSPPPSILPPPSISPPSSISPPPSISHPPESPPGDLLKQMSINETIICYLYDVTKNEEITLTSCLSSIDIKKKEVVEEVLKLVKCLCDTKKRTLEASNADQQVDSNECEDEKPKRRKITSYKGWQELKNDIDNDLTVDNIKNRSKQTVPLKLLLDEELPKNANDTETKTLLSENYYRIRNPSILMMINWFRFGKFIQAIWDKCKTEQKNFYEFISKSGIDYRPTQLKRYMKLYNLLRVYPALYFYTGSPCQLADASVSVYKEAKKNQSFRQKIRSIPEGCEYKISCDTKQLQNISLERIDPQNEDEAKKALENVTTGPAGFEEYEDDYKREEEENIAEEERSSKANDEVDDA